MNPKIVLKRQMLAIALLVIAPCLLFSWYLTSKQPIKRNQTPAIIATPLPQPKQVRYWLPVRLKIPAIDVDSAIEFLGLAPGGEMATTKNPNNVAWYKPGQRPGEKGSAVMAGHSGWKSGTPAVFDHLAKLQVGDKLYVEDETRTTITFVVREIRNYGQADDAKNVFSSSDGKAHLNLITCEGAWDKASHSYSKRLVAFADKE